MRLLPALPLLLVALAGCLADGPASDAADADPDPLADLARLIGEPITELHDHLDVSLHTDSVNVEFVDWSSLGVELGRNGFANFVLHSDEDERLAFVAVDGDADGGFVIADVSDPDNITPLGRYWVDGNNIQEVRVTPDGDYAVMNIQTVPSNPGYFTSPDAGEDCMVCIHVVDVRDRANPRLVSALPVELLGTHNFHFEQYDDGLYLFYVGQPLAGAAVDPGNHVWVARFEEAAPGQAALVPVSEFAHDRSDDVGRSFPHDVMVQDHPLTGQKVAYVSHWNGGHVLFDVTDPLRPAPLDVLAEAAPSDALAVHWIWQEEWTRPDGRVIAWSAPEIGSLESGTGVVRALDVTDPGDVRQVGTWTLPGNATIPGRYILSPHTLFVDERTGLAAVSHYHAGVWILDASVPEAPRHVGYYQPHGDPEAPHDGPLWWKKPNFSPDGYGPNVYQSRWDDRGEGLLWVSDRGTGLYALRYTGPVPGALS